MSPQLRSVLAKVLDVHYRGKDEPKFVIGALVRIAGEPTFSIRLGIESIRAARKLLCDSLVGEGDFLEVIQDPKNRAVVEQWSLASSYCIRRSSGRDTIPLLVEEDE
jgi:hypothetical protein